MTIVVWALFGLTAASLGVLSTALFTSMNRIDDARAHSDAQFGALRMEIAGLRDDVGGQINGVCGEVNGCAARSTACAAISGTTFAGCAPR